MRKGFDGLAMLEQPRLMRDPFGGHVFALRGKRGNLLELLWWDGHGMYSLIEICKLNGIDPLAWLNDVLKLSPDLEAVSGSGCCGSRRQRHPDLPTCHRWD